MISLIHLARRWPYPDAQLIIRQHAAVALQARGWWRVIGCLIFFGRDGGVAAASMCGCRRKNRNCCLERWVK